MTVIRELVLSSNTQYGQHRGYQLGSYFSIERNNRLAQYWNACAT